MKEEKVIGSDFIDSSVWLSYFIDSINKETIEKEEILLTSVLSLFEIKKKLLEKNVPNNEIIEKINFVKKKSIIISITNEIAEESANICVKNKLPAIDSLIYVSSLKQNSTLITLDNDFRGLEKVEILS